MYPVLAKNSSFEVNKEFGLNNDDYKDRHISPADRFEVNKQFGLNENC